jgi:SAM-dependent methyltransferase
MHDSVMNFVTQNLDDLEVRGKRVLEVGSYNVNGTLRSIVMPMQPAEYLGVDMREGPCVDRVVDFTRMTEPLGLYDVVLCAEMLEHVDEWRAAVDNLKRHIAEDGSLLLTTRSWGFPLHEYPGDFWRFEHADMERIFGDMEILTLERDPMVPGVFIKARPPRRSTGTQGQCSLSDIHVRAMESR